jgi:E3 ubiquitin-protein ligase MYCBP2
LELRVSFLYWRPIYQEVSGLISKIILEEKLSRDPLVQNPASEYFQRPYHFARDKFLFCRCAACRSIFFGGRLACHEDGDAPTEYICNACQGLRCARHGDGGMIFKCFFCCNPAEWLCFGTTHFCEECHNAYMERRLVPALCNGKCAFPGHPPNGTTRKFGFCAHCRSG